MHRTQIAVLHTEEDVCVGIAIAIAVVLSVNDTEQSIQMQE